jgi:hypothetical protein
VGVKLPDNEIFLGTWPSAKPFRVRNNLPRFFLHPSNMRPESVGFQTVRLAQSN